MSYTIFVGSYFISIVGSYFITVFSGGAYRATCRKNIVPPGAWLTSSRVQIAALIGICGAALLFSTLTVVVPNTI
jgi:hypothetical protein